MTASDATPGPGLPPGLNSIAIVRPVLESLLLAHTFLILLFPLLFALLYYSTPHSRRQPIFILNVLNIAMALSSGMIADITGIHTILSPQEMLPLMLFIASGIISIFQAMLVDLILLMRLVSVYPLGRVGPRRFALVTSLPIILKVARIANVVIFLKILTDIANQPNSGMKALTAYFALPYLKIEWVAQVVDNAYASIMFLWTIHGRGSTSECFRSGSTAVRSTLVSRLRSLFRIALSNFVIPALFSIVQLIIIFHNVEAGYVGDVVYVNGMLSVYGVVFASVWAGKENRRKLKEARLSLSLENSNRNRSTNTTPGTGTWKVVTAPRPVSAVGAMEAMVNSQSQGLDGTLSGAKRDFLGVDLEASHDIALVPLAKWEGEVPLPSLARSCGGISSS